jgi:hypothetical protein
LSASPSAPTLSDPRDSDPAAASSFLLRLAAAVRLPALPRRCWARTRTTRTKARFTGRRSRLPVGQLSRSHPRSQCPPGPDAHPGPQAFRSAPMTNDFIALLRLRRRVGTDGDGAHETDPDLQTNIGSWVIPGSPCAALCLAIRSACRAHHRSGGGSVTTERASVRPRSRSAMFICGAVPARRAASASRPDPRARGDRGALRLWRPRSCGNRRPRR